MEKPTDKFGTSIANLLYSVTVKRLIDNAHLLKKALFLKCSYTIMSIFIQQKSCSSKCFDTLRSASATIDIGILFDHHPLILDAVIAMEINTASKPKYYLSKRLDGFFGNMARAFRFVLDYFVQLVRPPYEFSEIVKQSYKIGVDSLPLISLTGFIIGIVFTKQSRPSLSDFGATSWLPSLIGIAVFKALAPLVTALICAGKVGSSIGAELGAMKVSEQIEAMDVSASKPYKYLVFTRVTACVLMVPLLMLFTSLVAMTGSYINININEHISLATFVAKAFDKINFLDFKASLIKAVVFGFTIGMVACYNGFTTSRGTEGVGRAANAAVVTSMYLIFIEELMIVQIIGWFR